MKKTAALSVIILLFPSYAFAYDDLITGANPYTVSENIGILTADPAFVYLKAGDRIDADGDKQSLDDDTTDFRIPVSIRLRITETFEAFSIMPIVWMNTGGEAEKGLGDIWLGAKYAVLPEGLLSIRGAVNMANGDDDKGLGNTGGFGIDAGAIGEKSCIENRLLARAQLGLRWTGENSDTKIQPGTGVYLTAGLGYMIAEKTWIHGGLELMNFGDNEVNGNTADDSGMTNLDLQLGVGRDFGIFGLNAGFIYTVMGKNTLANSGLRLSCGYKF